MNSLDVLGSFEDVKVDSSFSFRIDKVNIELEEWPYTSSYFDFVICFETLEHLKYNPAWFASEANRVLKSGGLFLLTTPNSSSLRAMFNVLSGRSPFTYPHFIVYKCKLNSLAHPKEYSFVEIQSLVHNAGFKVVNHSTFSPYDNYTPHQCIGSDSNSLRVCLYRFNNVIRAAKRIGYDMRLAGDTHFLLSEKVSAPINILFPELYHTIGLQQTTAFSSKGYWSNHLRSTSCDKVVI